MKTRTLLRSQVLLVCWLLAAPAAHAVDGVLEIHQACVADGCFPGDDPGFPVEITASGSYRLTSNLDVADENTTAITYSADDVTIDLNGFAIRGVTQCTQDGSTLEVTCTPAGTGTGIIASPVTAIRGRITNGSIVGMGNNGLLLGGDTLVEYVRVTSNASHGLVCNDDVAGFGCSIFHSTFSFNGGLGVGTVTLLVENVLISNGGSGAVGVGLARHNSVFENKLGGLSGFSTAVGNVVGGNGGFGLSSSSGGYALNVIRSNNGGNANPQVDGGTEIGTNICGGDTTCP